MMVAERLSAGTDEWTTQILNYSKFVVTQIYDQNTGCVVSPNMDPQAAAYCGTRTPASARSSATSAATTLGR